MTEFSIEFFYQLQTVAMEMATDTTTNSHNSHKMISSQATATVTVTAMAMAMDSMAIQAIGHKMTSNQLHRTTPQITSTYLHNLIHLNHNLNGPTINTSHHHKIKIVQMATETAISIHKADIDTKAKTHPPNLSAKMNQVLHRSIIKTNEI